MVVTRREGGTPESPLQVPLSHLIMYTDASQTGWGIHLQNLTASGDMDTSRERILLLRRWKSSTFKFALEFIAKT